MDPLAPGRTRIAAGHRSVRVALVYEDEAARFEAPYTVSPARPFGLVALGGEVLLFLGGNPSLLNARHIVVVETARPCASSKSWQCSVSVRSGLARSWEGKRSFSASHLRAGGPGIGRGSTSPISRRILRCRLMVGCETPKVAGNLRPEYPPVDRAQHPQSQVLQVRSHTAVSYGINAHATRCKQAKHRLVGLLMADGASASLHYCGSCEGSGLFGASVGSWGELSTAPSSAASASW